MLPGSDEPQAHPSGDRRRDAAVREIELRARDLALIALECAGELIDSRHLRVDLLLRDGVTGDQRLVPLKIDLRVSEGGFVFRRLTFGLRELHLKWTRIDVSDHVALVHDLTLAQVDVHQLTVDATANCHGAQRRHGAEPRQSHADVTRRRSFRDDGQRPRSGAAPCSWSRGLAPSANQPETGRQEDDGSEEEPCPSPCRPSGARPCANGFSLMRQRPKSSCS